MATGGRTVINVRGMKRMEQKIRDGLRSPVPSPINDAFKQWSFRYRSAMRERYDRFSKGGGNWPPLKAATIARRRHGKGGRFQRGGKALARAVSSGGGSVSILRDTGTMFMVFSPIFKHLAGQYEKRVPFGIVVGYGGSERHPEGKMTVARLAEIHHKGLGHNPKRTLLIDPPDPLKKQMAGDMERAMQKIVDASQVRTV